MYIFMLTMMRMMRVMTMMRRRTQKGLPEDVLQPVFALLAEASDVQKIQLNHFINCRAFPQSQRYDSVPVLIRAKAPRYTQRSRAPIDLVMVLVICGTVEDENKLDQIKQGCKFVVHNLEATDRLSLVVSSNNDAKLICFPLRYMSDEAKRWTNKLIASLQPRPGTDVKEAMKLAYEGLHGSRFPENNRVSSVILLSDGQLDIGGGEDLTYAEEHITTYTLGLGLGHDPFSLYSSGARGHGTYSFVVENYENIRDALALHIGGLTSIVAWDVEICIRSAHPDLRISDIMCGGYDSSVEDGGKSRTIRVNDLCASEEKNFIVFVNVPAEEAASIFSGTPKTKLLSVTASYFCSTTWRDRVHTDPMEISVERPRRARAQDAGNISVEVASEIIRAKVFNGVNEIWSRGIQRTTVAKDVTEKLDGLRKDIEGTNEAKAAMDQWLDLCVDLDCMQKGGSSDELYVETAGLPYMLSWLSSHQLQRAATPGSTSKSRCLNFRTTRMQNMIESVDSAPSAYVQ